MVNTRNNQSEGGGSTPEQIAAQLAAIVAKLDSMESLKEDVAALKHKNKEKTSGGFGRFEEGETSWNNQRSYRPYNKIEFPKYSDGDPRGWILKAEKYFWYYNIPDTEKVDIASMHLEGDALDLYSWLSTDHPISFWEELVQALTKNFGPAEFQNPDEHLCSIKQTGTVQEYRQEFAKRSSRVSDWPDHCLLGIFLNGLKEELKADVRIHIPRIVYNAMSLALQFESKTTNSSSNKFAASITKPTDVTIAAAGNSNSVPPTHISEAEKQSRFFKGECFKCGEKFGPGHRCKTSSLKLLEASDQVAKVQVESEEKEDGNLAVISLNAIIGTPHHQTLIVQGSINSSKVSVLIDCGSTHNFLKNTLVPIVGITTHEVVPFGVKIGNGDIIRCTQVCKDIPLHIGNLQITQDFYPFSLGGADVVLGIQWLATLNTVQANWSEMFMKFTVEGKDYTLQGAATGTENSATFQQLTAAPAQLTTAPAPPIALLPASSKYYIDQPISSGVSQCWVFDTGPQEPSRVIPSRLEDKSFIRAGSIDRNPTQGPNGSRQLGKFKGQVAPKGKSNQEGNQKVGVGNQKVGVN